MKIPHRCQRRDDLGIETGTKTPYGNREPGIGPFHPTPIREARYESAAFQSHRQYLTVGAGVLLADSFTLDAAYMHGGFKRSGTESSTQTYQEEQKDRRVFVSLTMRLR